MKQFQSDHAALEQQFCAQALKDGDVFIPNIPPAGPVDYIIIGMEPSLGHWAKGASPAARKANALAKVSGGFKNFMFSAEDFLLHFAFTRFLCGQGESYHLTDLSKGAMLVKLANESKFKRWYRWRRWHPFLCQEIELVKGPKTGIFALGQQVTEFLMEMGSPGLSSRLRSWNGAVGCYPTLLQHSQSGARWRKITPGSDPLAFNRFCDSLAPGEIKEFARRKVDEVFPDQGLRQWMHGRIDNFEISHSRLELLFTYKFQLSSMADHS